MTLDKLLEKAVILKIKQDKLESYTLDDLVNGVLLEGFQTAGTEPIKFKKEIL